MSIYEDGLDDKMKELAKNHQQQDAKGVRQVLLDLLSEYQAMDKPVSPDFLKMIIEMFEDKLYAELQEIMLGMLPEKIKLGKAVYKNVGDGYASERIGYKHGFNDALADMEQNIRGGFNNG